MNATLASWFREPGIWSRLFPSPALPDKLTGRFGFVVVKNTGRPPRAILYVETIKKLYVPEFGFESYTEFRPATEADCLKLGFSSLPGFVGTPQYCGHSLPIADCPDCSPKGLRRRVVNVPQSPEGTS